MDRQTFEAAKTFFWDRGPVHVHIHSKHVGIHGQWINTWRKPKFVSEQNSEINIMNTRKNETLVVILEDDVDISRFAYRWLRRAHVKYGD